MSSTRDTSHPLRLCVCLNWKITLLTALALPMLIGLGFWQLDRGAQKRAIEAQLLVQKSAPPAVLTGENIAQLKRFQKVIAQGSFDNKHTWLLDNKQRQGRVGFEVISPFELRDGTVILVNRGWIEGTGDRRQLPDIPDVPGEQTLFAGMAEIVEHPLLDAESVADQWPRIVMALEAEAMGDQLGRPVAEMYLKIHEASPGAFETGWRAVNMSPQTHTGYAFQWFAMAVALTVWFVFANSNLLAWWRSRNLR